MASYQQLRRYFIENVDSNGVDTTAWNNRYNDWVNAAMQELGVSSPEQIPDYALSPDYQGPDGGTEVPLEQGLLDTVLPGLLQDVNNDADRQAVAGDLASQLQISNQEALDLIRRATSGELLQQDLANADRTTTANIDAVNQSMATQLAALSEATSAMQSNLSGELASKAAALQQQIGTLLQNLDQLDATQRAALTQQVQEMQQNLETSLATQRAALEQQILSLQGAAGAEADARRAALTQEIASLTAAQAPLADARVKAAELQATAVNLGLQSTQDQLRADAAREGFVGGSTMQDAALARAAVDARQNAAGALGQANLANATDTRDIAARGATGERTIAEALAAAQREISGQRATGTAALDVAGATGRQQLGDQFATGKAALTNQTAANRAAINAQGANTTYQDSVAGASGMRSILDQLASGTAATKVAGAQQTQEAQQAGNAAKATYYDNDWARALSAATMTPGLTTNLVGSLSALDNYGRSGVDRTLNTLNWWSNPSTAPTPGAVAVQPSTSGNGLSTLGSSLVGAGLNLGTSNDWWRTSKITTPVRDIWAYEGPTQAVA